MVVVAGMSSLALAGGTPTNEKDWHKQIEDFVNGTGEDASGNSLRDQHKKIVDACGHDLQVKFDWSGFDMKQWTDSYHTAAVCAANMQLSDLASACEAGNAKAKKIKTLTCHYKACAKLPDPPNSSPGSNLKATEAQYKLTNKGANLDETFCENVSNLGRDAFDAFLKK